ncbi:MAG: 2-oxo acid dehydrogenase subunit E2 [Gemmatimonadetes bacterium]|nr:2-oxo acid dehydrogenase subunit E2 [Gemmatimonadota bacterium]MBK9067825.1 2-oxo acid dehydrogenase subunit E2 [Gemmatimonadota bacterium]
MATKVLMEALSPTMEEGRLVEWKKQEGDAVAVGDVLAEVETDKAVMDLLARAAGVLLKHGIAAGTTVPVGRIVGVIGAAGEDVSALLGSAAPAAPPAPPRPAAAPAPAQPAAPTRVPAPAAPAAAPPPAAPPAPGGRVKASPLARRMAAEQGLDLARLQGSGPEGRIVVRDLAAAPPAASAPSTPGAVASWRPSGAAFTDVPLTQIRKTIARRLAESIGPVPTFYLTTEVDMERVAEAREALNETARRLGGSAARADETKISYNDIVLKCTALALRQHPACNAWWQDDRIRYWNEVHVSVAVAIEDGLITPVVRHADRKSLREIAVEVRDLAGRARDRRLKPEEYSGGTFSVSNLGMFEIDQFTAIINPPEAGILAVGSIAEKPVVHGGAVAARKRMRVTMSCDHRVIDGATGATFLKTFKHMLENPLALVW